MTMKISKLAKYRKMNMNDCYAAFDGIFGFSEDTVESGTFQGTMFRFPLRQTPTDLSENVYDTAKVNELFNAFQAEAEVELLFLKCLERIDLYVNDSGQHIEPVFANCLIYSVKVADDCIEETREGRQTVMKYLRTFGRKIADNTEKNHFHISIESINSKLKCKNDWIVYHILKGGQMSNELRNLSLDESLSYSPYTSIGVPLTNSNNFKGHVICLMPLPLQETSITGLPVHVNGYFALSQNRRHVKWPTADQTKHGTYKDKSLRWNYCLIKEVLADLYCNVIQDLIKCSATEDLKISPDAVALVDRMIPDYNRVTEHWNIICDPLFDQLLKSKFLFTENNGGSWISISEALFDVFPADVCCETRKSVLKFMLLNKQNVVHVRDSLLSLLKVKGYVIQTISPQLVANVTKDSDSLVELLDEEKLQILRFLLDYEDSSELDDIPLLPLHDGTFSVFSRNREKVFVGKEKANLFPGLENQFVREEISPEIYDRLYNISKQGRYQLCDITLANASDIAELLSRTIDRNFGNPENDCLVWRNLDSKTTGKTWLKRVWTFLGNRHLRLSHFQDLFIFPVMPEQSGCVLNDDENQYKNEITLFRLSKKFMLKAYEDLRELSDTVCRCLYHLSIFPIQSAWQEVLNHPDIWQYVRKPTVKNVCHALEEVYLRKTCNELIDNFNENACFADKCEFIELFRDNKLNDNVRKFLSCLKLFKEKNTERIVSKNEVPLIAHLESLPVKYHQENLDVLQKGHYLFALNLGAKEVCFEEAVLDVLRCVENGTIYSDVDQSKVVYYVMTNLKRFENRSLILEICKRISFVFDKQGTLRRASEFFDPEDELLRSILGEEHFPNLEMTCIRVKYLRKLGLKSVNDLTKTHITTCTKEIDEKCVQGTCTEKELKMSLTVLEILRTRPQLIDFQILNHRFLESLKKTQSYPAVLPWFEPVNAFCKPSDVIDVQYQNLVGSVKPLADSQLCDIFANKCGWVGKPDTKDVVKQLLMITNHYADSYKPQLLQLIIDIYHYLTDNTDKNQIDKFLECVSNREWIWTGSGFVQSAQVYLATEEEIGISLVPYLYPLPPEMQMLKFKTFFRLSNCLSGNRIDLCIKVLKMIKEAHESEVKSVQNNSTDLDLVVRVLNNLKQEQGIDLDEIMFPIHTETSDRLVLKPASRCNYCNEEWLREDADIEGKETYYVHHDIPMDTAVKLGVPSLTERLLEHTEGLEEWGQHEPLTRRLKTLLNQYKDGLSVFKELIQNADDAGATKVCFLYDERQNLNARTRLIDKNMAECQGPALWAYNDALFTQEDLKNITKLNGATKELDATKIGRFGLGFCSVYNITEVPSFISGNQIVIFDPHTKYLGLALRNKQQPGIKINISRNWNTIKTLQSQFLPFEGLFDCNLLSSQCPTSYKGTLFRFPLRTDQQAFHSEISSIVYNSEEMKRLLNMFMDSAGNLLLFTQHVSIIEMYHLTVDENPKNARLVFKNSRENKCPIERPFLSRNTKELDDLLQEKIKLKPPNTTYIDRSAHSTIWEMSLFSNEDAILCTTESISKTHWLVVWTKGASTSKILEEKYQEKGILSIAAIACPIDISDKIRSLDLEKLQKGYYQKGHIFCFLPLPLETDIPVHINGYFAVTEDRRRLCSVSSDDKTKSFEATWNEALMADTVCNGYLHFLENLQAMHPNEEYFSKWPTNKSTFDLIETFKRSFYNAVCQKNFKIFRRGINCFSFEKCQFLHPDIFETDFGDIALDACSKWGEEGLVAIELPRTLMNCFEHYVGETKASRKFISIFIFYEKIALPNFSDKFWKEKRNSMLLFALQSKDKKLNQLLKHYPCIPTEPDGKLKRPFEIVSKRGKVAVLFDTQDERFMQNAYQFSDVYVLQNLENLGMIIDTLSLELVIDRARSVERKAAACTSCAIKRCEDLLHYMSKNLRESELYDLSHLITFSFLPVMKPPENWTFTWGGNSKNKQIIKTLAENCEFCGCGSDDICFEKPSEACLFDCYQLVGTVNPILDKRLCDVHLNVCRGLGVKSKEDLYVDDILNNLANLRAESIGSKDENCLENLRIMTFDIYKYFNQIITQERKIAQLTSAFSKITDGRIIFVNDTFLHPKEVFIELVDDCRPYLYSLKTAPHMMQLKSFLKFVNIKHYADVNTVMKILCNLRNEYKTDPLPESVLKVYISLLRQLVESLHRYRKPLSSDSLRGIMVPDDRGVLTSVKLLCFDEENIKSGRKMKFTHDTISPALASSLGIMSKRKKKVQLCSRMRSRLFGQKEELTTRIKSILAGYTCDSGFLKELVQNADDAGASQVHIVADFHHHPTDKIFDESWKALQGPALLIYNDSVFSEDDLEGIQNLGIGSKRRDPTKTGQYGIGFNVVYHFTDVPSFLTKGPEVETGQILCVMDPNCRYVQEATPNNPGIEYLDLQELWEDYSDVFQCYHSNLLMKEKGTIFRLPLRTDIFAKHSGISKNPITINFAHKILQKLTTELSDLLLFVNNVRKIMVSEIKNDLLEEIYSIEATATNHSEQRQYNKEVCEAARIMVESGSIECIPCTQLTYTLTVNDSKDKTASWLLVRRLGMSNTTPVDVVRSVKNKELNLLPRGGIALDLTPTEYGLNNGKPFCFLPLPDVTGLPIHFNGHFVLDHETRRNLWNDQNKDFRSVWNYMVLKNIIAPAYVSCLLQLKQELDLSKCSELTHKQIKAKLSVFHRYFPILANAKNDYVKHLVISVYEHIFETNSKLFALCIASRIDFVPIRHPNTALVAVWNLLEENDMLYSIKTYLYAKTASTKTEKLGEICKRLGVRLIDTPRCIFDSMLQSGIKVEALSPTFLIMFLITVDVLNEKNECNLHESKFANIQNLQICLEYCQRDERFSKKISGLPTCLRQDNVIRKFSDEQPIFGSLYSDLLPESAAQFLHKDLVEMFPRNVPGIKEFTLDDLVEWLPYSLPPEKYRTLDRRVEWNPDSVIVPHILWIKRFWSFVADESLRVKPRILDIKKLLHWCFLPCKEANSIAKGKSKNKGKNVVEDASFFLYPVGHLHCVLDIQSFPPDLATALGSLCLPVLMYVNSYLNSQAPSFNNPVAVLECLYCNKHELQQRSETFSSDHCNKVLEYLCQSFNDSKISENVINWIKEIPLHVTILGQHVSLSMTNILIVPEGMPLYGINEWAIITNTTLLQDNYRLQNMYRALQCPSRSILQIYWQHLLPTFASLSVKYHQIHLEYIRDVLLAKYATQPFRNDQIVLIKQLQSVECIPDIKGNLRRASYFCSPFNDIMQKMCKRSRFPQNPFCDDIWKVFLELIGMQNVLSDKMVVEFVNSIAEAGRFRISHDIESKSEMMLHHILRRENVHNLLPIIANIKFIVPHQIETSKRNIFPQTSGNLICFSGSVFYESADLCWTTCTILPEYIPINLKYSHVIVKQLNIQSVPISSNVITHIQNIVDNLRKKGDENDVTPHKALEISNLLTTFYEWLMTNLKEPQIYNRLHQKPIVFLPRDRLLVNCNKVVQNLDENQEIKRYLMKAPTDFGRFFRVFQHLGMQINPTCYHYVKVLEYLHIDAGANELNDNEFRIVQIALKGILKEFHISKSDEALHESLTKITHLYLPSREKILLSANTMIYSDKEEWEHLIKEKGDYFIGFKALEMSVSSGTLFFSHLPASLRPRLLSELIRERLDENVLESVVNDISRKLSSMFKTDEFIRMIAHSLSPEHKRKLDNDEVTNIVKSIQSIPIVPVKSVVVDLVYDNNR